MSKASQIIEALRGNPDNLPLVSSLEYAKSKIRSNLNFNEVPQILDDNGVSICFYPGDEDESDDFTLDQWSDYYIGAVIFDSTVSGSQFSNRASEVVDILKVRSNKYFDVEHLSGKDLNLTMNAYGLSYLDIIKKYGKITDNRTMYGLMDKKKFLQDD